MASNATSTLGPVTHEQLGKVLIGFWALVPPVFLWTDWVGFRPADQNDKENAKHTHDLSRNIWLALVAVLTVLFNIKWTGG